MHSYHITTHIHHSEFRSLKTGTEQSRWCVVDDQQAGLHGPSQESTTGRLAWPSQKWTRQDTVGTAHGPRYARAVADGPTAQQPRGGRMRDATVLESMSGLLGCPALEPTGQEFLARELGKSPR